MTTKQIILTVAGWVVAIAQAVLQMFGANIPTIS